MICLRSSIAAAAFGCLCWVPAVRATAQPKIGDPAPEPVLERLLQAPPQSSTGLLHQGNLVVLDFWATWCLPCLADIPRMNRLIEEFEGRPVRFVSITDETEPVVEAFLQQTRMSGWVGLDLDRSAFTDYAISGLPRTALVDRQGRIAALLDPRQLSAEILESALAGRSIEPPAPQVLIRRIPFEELAQGHRGRATQAADARGLEAEGISLATALGLAFDVEPSRIRMGFIAPNDVYDVLVHPGKGPDYAWRGLLQSALQSTFGIRTRREEREVEVLLLSTIEGRPHLLQPGTAPAKLTTGGGRLAIQYSEVAGLVQVLEVSLRREVIDATGLEGAFDGELTWDMKRPDTLFTAIEEQLGLRLEPQTRRLELLVVEKD